MYFCENCKVLHKTSPSYGCNYCGKSYESIIKLSKKEFNIQELSLDYTIGELQNKIDVVKITPERRNHSNFIRMLFSDNELLLRYNPYKFILDNLEDLKYLSYHELLQFWNTKFNKYTRNDKYFYIYFKSEIYDDYIFIAISFPNLIEYFKNPEIKFKIKFEDQNWQIIPSLENNDIISELTNKYNTNYGNIHDILDQNSNYRYRTINSVALYGEI